MNPRLTDINNEEEEFKLMAEGKKLEAPKYFFKPKKLLKAEIIQNAILEEKKSKMCVIL